MSRDLNRRARRALTGAVAALALLAGVSCTGTGGGQPSGPVSAITITVNDPTVGRLSFDALAAGSPDAARAGRLVLLLHGFPQTDDAYRRVLAPLAEAGYYAVAPNQRGYSAGARPAAVADYELRDLAADVLGMATALGADRFGLVGHDWGGAVAWETAAEAPQRVAALVALSTSHPDAFAEAFNAPNSEQRRMSSYINTVKQPGSETLLTAGGPAGLQATLTAMGIPAASAADYARVLGTPAAMRGATNWYRANTVPNPVRTGPVAVPTRYVWGTADAYFSRVGVEATARFVSAPYQLQVLNGASHWLPETRTEDVTAAILAHLG
jgi:pimeloyl-ACP methyl ester carboxylesterase